MTLNKNVSEETTSHPPILRRRTYNLERRKAIRWLRSAYQDGCSIMLSLALPEFDELRSEPAFQELVAKVG